jgi:hypothetical protein
MSESEESVRLTNEEVGGLMKQRKIPFTTNHCVSDYQPLAMVQGQVRCVRVSETEWCETCPFYNTRNWESKPSSGSGARIEFEAFVRQMSNRQFIVTIPFPKAFEAGLQKDARVRITMEIL